MLNNKAGGVGGINGRDAGFRPGRGLTPEGILESLLNARRTERPLREWGGREGAKPADYGVFGPNLEWPFACARSAKKPQFAYLE